MTETVWKLERRLWLEGADAYRQLMHPGCLMVFGPAGILEGKQISKALEDAPRWVELSVSEERTLEGKAGFIVIAYKAEARREDGRPYRARCSSTYVESESGWKIVQHQQTAID